MLANSYFYILTAILSHWKRKPLQLFLILIGLTTATSLWSSVHLINVEAKKSYVNANKLVNASSERTLLPKKGKFFTDTHYAYLRRAGWNVTPRLQGKIPVLNTISIIGIDFFNLANKQFTSTLLPQMEIKDYFRSLKFIFSGPNTAEKLKKQTNLKNILVMENIPEGHAITDISVAQKILNLEGSLTSLELIGEPPADLSELSKLDLHIEKYRKDSDLESLTKSFHLNLSAFGLLSYIVGLFIVYSTVNLAYEQRKGLLRTLRGLGVSAISVILLMISEVLMLSLIAGNFGVILSYFLASALLPDVTSTLSGLFGANINNVLTINHDFWFTSVGISVFGAICASGTALWNICTLPPLDGAKRIAWYTKTKSNLKYQLITVIILVLCIVYFFKFGDGLISAFLLLGSVLITATLTLPMFLWLSISLIMKFRFKNPLAQWFLADSKQQINSLSVSLMALLIALSVNIGVGGMVESFRKTFVGWLDQRLVSEVYITASDIETAASVLTYLDKKVDTILPIVTVSKKIKDNLVEIYGFTPHKTYEDHWPLISSTEETWEKIKQNKGLLINEQLWRRLDLKIGDWLSFDNVREKNMRLEILGVYSDYGNPKGQVMLPLELFEGYFSDVPQLRFAIRMKNNLAPELIKNVQSKFISDEISITNQNKIKKISLKIFDKTFTITTALSLLTLGVAGIALFTSITTLSDNRNSQLAPLWAMGVQRHKLALLEALRALMLASLTFIFAVPIGLVIVFILTNYVNLEAFDWKLPIYYFPHQWLELFAISFIMTALSILFHSIKLSKASPADLLRASSYAI